MADLSSYFCSPFFRILDSLLTPLDLVQIRSALTHHTEPISLQSQPELAHYE